MGGAMVQLPDSERSDCRSITRDKCFAANDLDPEGQVFDIKSPLYDPVVSLGRGNILSSVGLW